MRGLDSCRPYFIQFTMKATKEEFFRTLREEANKPIDPMELVYPKEIPIFEKYDEHLPAELVRKGFAYGVLDIDGMLAAVNSWCDKEGF
jgi:ATP-dependent Lhr-like helicase